VNVKQTYANIKDQDEQEQQHNRIKTERLKDQSSCAYSKNVLVCRDQVPIKTANCDIKHWVNFTVSNDLMLYRGKSSNVDDKALDLGSILSKCNHDVVQLAGVNQLDIRSYPLLCTKVKDLLCLPSIPKGIFSQKSIFRCLIIGFFQNTR
jgi:hypothetical protein